MLLLAGVFLLVLGLFSGAVLLLAPFGVVAQDPGFALWVLFPLLCLVGFGMLAVQAKASEVRTITLCASAVLLLFALASVAGIVLSAASMIAPPMDSAPLWFVLAVGAILGSFGAASFGGRTSHA